MPATAATGNDPRSTSTRPTSLSRRRTATPCGIRASPLEAASLKTGSSSLPVTRPRKSTPIARSITHPAPVLSPRTGCGITPSADWTMRQPPNCASMAPTSGRLPGARARCQIAISALQPRPTTSRYRVATFPPRPSIPALLSRSRRASSLAPATGTSISTTRTAIMECPAIPMWSTTPLRLPAFPRPAALVLATSAAR